MAGGARQRSGTETESMRPVLLGGGIKLLPDPAERAKLKLTKQRVYSTTGTVALEYEVA